MKIEINKEKIELKQTLRSMIIYEKITEKPFNIQNISDVIIYFYSCVVASNTEISITLDSFIDWLDLHKEAFEEFNRWLIEEATKTEQASGKKTKKKK